MDITVDDMLKDPHWIPERIKEQLTGQFLGDLLFRNGGTNDGVVGFREAADPYLTDDAEDVAEHAEIPVADIGDGKVRSIIGHKAALAVRISYEERTKNRLDRATQKITGLKKTMIRSSVQAALAAFDAADVPTISVDTPWDAGGNPVADVTDGKRSISSASVDDDRTKPFGYVPDTMVLNGDTLSVLEGNEAVQRFYRGNLADKNPQYTGIQPTTLFNLRVIASPFVDLGKVILMESGTAGFYSDTYPLTLTPFYEEGGNSGYGGPRMTWRSDAFQQRILAVDNPQAVCILDGVTTP